MKYYLLGIMVAFPCLAHAQTPISYTIRGTIGRVSAPAKVYLLRMEPVSFGSPMIRSIISDSAMLVNGKFELKGTAVMPAEATLCLQRNGRRGQDINGLAERRQFFLEPGPIIITSPDSLTNASIKGGPLTAEYQKLTSSLQPITAQNTALNTAYEKASVAERNTPAFQRHSWEIGTRLESEKLRLITDFVKANPNSWVSLHALQMLFPLPQYAELAAAYKPLGPALKSSTIGQQYEERLRELQKVAIGAAAPTFSQSTPEGKLVSLTDYRGKYVLLEFWASWCGPCRAETPNISKAYQQYKTRNFDVLSVSLDSERGRAKWLQAIKEDGTTWTQVSDLRGFNSAVAKLYSISSIPQNFLLDPSGRIIAVNLRSAELQATLARVLK